MKKILLIQLVLIACLWGHPVFATEGADPEISDLTPWLGHCVSIIELYQGESADTYFTEVARHAPDGYTAEMVKKFIYSQFAVKFKSIDFADKDTIVIDDRISGKYSHVGNLTTKWKDVTTKWEIFKTDSAEMIEAGFKYVMLFPFHQPGQDSLRHAHLRYGNENFDFLATDPSVQAWWPTIYQPETTDEAKTMAAMIHGAKLQASILPALKTVDKD
ncbi:MAG: hypothetical protein V3571_09325 [Pseudodesulfovibrio sp.]